MRQRRIKDIDEKLEGFGFLTVDDPAGERGGWRESFFVPTDRERAGLFLEIGCGKGTFITRMAEAYPESFFIGAEGNGSVILRSLEKTAAKRLGNVRFIVDYVSWLPAIFDDGELDGIFLNFCAPWPKARHAKRRLTHPSYLAQYAQVLAEGGSVRFKTDNDELFEWSLTQAEENAESLGFVISAVTRDLERSVYFADSPASEYEEKFSGAGKNINYFELIKKGPEK